MLKFKYCVFEQATLLMLLASSCSDDVSIPPLQEIDTTDRYEWTLDTIYGYSFYDLYVVDSNNIFFVSPLNLVFYNGENYIPVSINDPSFHFRGVEGFDKNNIFVAGQRVNSKTPLLKKLEMNNIYSYEITGDTGYFVTDIFVEGPNQVWLAISESNTVYYFNTGVFTPYTLDSGVRSGNFFRDTFGSLFYFGLKITTLHDYMFYIYKYYNNSFDLINIDSVNTSSIRIGSGRCGTDMVALGRTSIYYFNIPNWEQFCNTSDFNPKSVSGTSRNNLICYGTKDFYDGSIYVWNGETWYKENSKVIPTNFYFSVTSAMTNGKVNLIISDDYNQGISYHLKGKPKPGKE